MPVSPEISEGLRNSSKGQLTYDRDFFRAENFNDALKTISDDWKYTAIRDVCAVSPTGSAVKFSRSPPGTSDKNAANETLKEIRKHSKSNLSKNGINRDELSTVKLLPSPAIFEASKKATGCAGSSRALPNQHPTCSQLNELKVLAGSDSMTEESGQNVDRTELCLSYYETYRIQNVHRTFDKKRDEFTKHEKASFEKSLKNLEVIQGRRKLEQVLRSKDLAVKHSASKNESEKRHQMLKDEHVSLAKLSDKRLKEATLKDKMEQEAAIKRNNEFKQKINAFIESKQNIFTTYQEIASLVKSCANVGLLSQDVFQAVQSVNEMTNAIHRIVDGIRGGKIEQADVDLAQAFQDRTLVCLDIIKVGVELVNKKVSEEADAANRTPQENVPLPPSYDSSSHGTIQVKDKQQRSFHETEVIDTIDASSRLDNSFSKRYFLYMELLERTKDAYQDLATNATLKRYKGDVQKAVITQVNAISSGSGIHLMEKLQMLCKVIAGNQVDVGNRRMSITDHPQGRAFCLDIMAKKFVSQGEEQISSNHEAAFAIAMVIVGLLKSDPVFGELLLAHFYNKCSYLVPFYLARGEDQSEEEYYTALGYKISNGILEEKDLFLKRLAGMVRLYAAILQSSLPRGFSPPHPHGIENGWTLITQILNMDPLPDITATVLFHFLEVCGHTLHLNYGKQFKKLLFLLCQDYFPRIQHVTPSDSGGPVGRLENFLQKCLKEGQIPPPQGVLPANFWST